MLGSGGGTVRVGKFIRSIGSLCVTLKGMGVIHFPNALLSRVLKAKYFSDSDILDVVPKTNALFTWKSICGALNLVREGTRWRVGNGD